MRRQFAAALLVASCTAGVAEPKRPDHPTPDGSVAIIGDDGMAPLLDRLNAIVTRGHPGLRFSMTLKGSSTGLPALAAGATLVAPLSRESWVGERAGFRQIHGYDATAIRIGYSGWGPRPDGKTPPAVYVNRDNPTMSLALSDLGRIFGSGAREGDVNLWSQLGVVGDAGKRRIHLYGLRDDGGTATAFRGRFLRDLPYADAYEPLDGDADVIRAVAADPFGIGIADRIDAGAIDDRVRILGISTEAAPAGLPSRADVAEGLYPLSAPLQLFVDKAKDRPLDPLARSYLQAALSDEGQAIIAALADGAEGYLPLSPADLVAERAKLDAL